MGGKRLLRLVYTERVGGSSPSPTTGRSIRFLGLAFALALCALLLPTGVLADAGSMTFRVEPLQTGGCGARCPNVIVADGVIEADTPPAFVEFLRSDSTDPKLRRFVFFNSRGGNVDASIVFGHILRELKVTGVVGRIEGGTVYFGECLSACVYAMMGTVRRVAPPGSEVALHRMSTVVTESGGWGGPTRVTRSVADAPMVAVLKRYARRMGVSPALVAAAESLPPDTMHVLTREEMRRWSFATGQL